MRCAAIRFSSDRFAVRRTSVPPVCGDPPAATRRAMSLRPAARLRVAVATGVSNRCFAAGARSSAISASGKRDKVPISNPANVTDSASRLRRRPSHVAHVVPDMKRATRFFISALCVLAKVSST